MKPTMVVPREGETHAFERVFTVDDVRRFADISKDSQPRHVESDSEGRLLVHGLLTATMPTKIGGDLEVLARTMEFTFHEPVYTEETITCSWTTETVTEHDDRYALSASVVCRNDDDAVVMTAEIAGLVWKESTE